MDFGVPTGLNVPPPMLRTSGSAASGEDIRKGVKRFRTELDTDSPEGLHECLMVSDSCRSMML